MGQSHFTADTHFSHGNIVRYSHRPFANVREMDECLIERWNQVVRPEDTVYHLGDVCLGSPGRAKEILSKLNGSIHLILGNHDKNPFLKFCGERFESISPMKDVYIQDPEASQGRQHIVCCHYAMRTWNKRHWGSWCLYGHSHNELPELPNELSFDAGVDGAEPFGTPYSYPKVKERMSKKTWTPPIHHNREPK